ncbi:MAG: LysM peptidoglycan-binding domain-containing protein [Solirubrobacteraceae bacterium]
MRARILIPLAAAAMLVAPASASAFFSHTVTSGESLSSIAAADGVSVAQLAAGNGLPLNASLVAGSALQIPPQGASLSGLSSSGSATTGGDGDGDGDDVGAGTSRAVPVSTSSSGSYVVAPGDTLSAIAARAGTTATALAAANGLDVNAVLPAGAAIRLSGSPSGSTAVQVGTTSSGAGSYLVVPGDTLTAIAARAGTTPAALAAANGLDPNGVLLSGSTIHVPSGSTALPVSTTVGGATAETQPVGAVAQGNPTSPPYPTPERLSASQIASVADQNGVPGALADAIAWQESGFNNDLVSSADARGIMQILPGTWDWIQRNLTPSAPLAPASATENVRGGVLLLRSLLNSTGGDTSTAAAGYYQGLPSVQAHGMYPSTQQYVQSVQALERQFGGG